MIRICMLLMLMVIATGCQNLARSSAGASASSASVGLISASSNSSAAASNSSARKANQQAYRGDIRSVTVVSVQSGTSADQLFAQVGRIAASYGLLDWRSDTDTCHAIGEGLRQAGLDSTAAGEFASAAKNDKSAHLIMAGYHS
jgi:hypothetical protein